MQKQNYSIEAGLKNIGIKELKDIQVKALETYKKGNDIILSSPTGTGKTLAFVLPILEQISKHGKNKAIIISPTRELSLQIETVIKSLRSPFKVNCCYGGHSFKTERNNLQTLPEFLIGTPGRIADHLRRNTFNPLDYSILVLDEFDKSLDLGFHNEMEFIIEEFSKIRQKILTSATTLDSLPSFIKLRNRVLIENAETPAKSILTNKMVRAEWTDKLDILFNLLCHIQNEPALVFCNHRESVDRISDHLKVKGIAHDTFHGGLDQEVRERSLIKFRNESHHTLVTTDLASRGLDIPQIKHVIHYHLSVKEEDYIHRNGRTARMDSSGTSWLILKHDEALPEYANKTEEEILPDNQSIPELPFWQTLYIGGGKKDKINKVDIVGFLGNIAKLNKTEIGLIEVKDKMSYVAIPREKANQIINMTLNQRVKRKKVKIALSK